MQSIEDLYKLNKILLLMGNFVLLLQDNHNKSLVIGSRFNRSGPEKLNSWDNQTPANGSESGMQ